jgi:ParB family transcriptional regulator, chromosome partitioning protein
MQEIVIVSPLRCRVWSMHGRMEEYITEASCREEIQSMREHGQLVPAVGRPLRDDSTYEIEVICGTRRLFAARCLNIDLRVEMRELTDREAFVLVDLENRQRRDLSAYERGRHFACWLATEHFKSQDELAKVLRISASQVSRLLKLAKLPSVIVDAFSDPVDICEKWGQDLHSACGNPSVRPRIIARARTLGAKATRPSARAVYEQLIGASHRQH